MTDPPFKSPLFYGNKESVINDPAWSEWMFKLAFTLAKEGCVMTNASGTVRKRVRLNPTGTGIIFEDA